MRWMHISDIHMNIEFNNVISNIMREELPNFIKENKIEVDNLFITGDYRDSSYMREKYLHEDMVLQAVNVSKYILAVAEALKITPKQIFLVPGNHDLKRQGDDEVKIQEIKRSYPAYRQELNDLERDYLLSRFEFFNIIERQIHPEGECGALHRFYRGDEADILCLNTAVSCYGGEKQGDLILDTEYIRKLMDNSQSSNPVIVLAHHDLNFFTKSDQQVLMAILKNRKIFYLCGHSHKLEYHYDDDESKYKIMVGATKYESGAAPIISIGEILNSGTYSNIHFYKYHIKSKNGWDLYQEFSNEIKLYRLGFIDGHSRKQKDINFDVVQLPLIQTMASTEEQRAETIERLADKKNDLCRLGKQVQILVSSDGLPVNAGIIIGYALHNRQSIRISYLNGDMVFSNGEGKQIIPFDEETREKNICEGKLLSLYVYIQAKVRDDGLAAFNEYCRNKKSYLALTFVNKDYYDESFDLERSAEILIDRIVHYYESYRQKGFHKVKVHLFYNGFWGLALLLGNQMPTTFPVQLYDYQGSDQKYYLSFELKPDIFKK